EAESYAQLVLEQEEPQSHPYALYTLGTIRRKMQNLTEAALYYEQARQVAVMNEDNFLLAYALAALAHIYWEQKEHQHAMHMVEQAIKHFTQLGIDDQLPPLHELAAAISAAQRTNAV
ncbi:MAG: tetratricopeptide repeat protein, partial [Caldilineaceae bacterium]|nr:tetratricopeptide repeat protein [Caldilineaceae bacterium]MCB0187781.1 tetratricopeptide repeat protein [Caldilineaceae bacterium]